jgi:hypothetical protein
VPERSDPRAGGGRRGIGIAAALALLLALGGLAVGVWNLIDTTEPVDPVQIAP